MSAAPKMTIRQIASAAGCNHKTVRAVVDRLYPGRTRNGIRLELSAEESLSIMERLPKRNFVSPSARKAQEAFVYLMRVAGSPVYKIGVSTNITRRLRGLRTGNPLIECVASFYSPLPFAMEKTIHALFMGKNVGGEFFVLHENDLSLLRERFGFQFHVSEEGAA